MQDHFAALEDPHRARRLADRDRDRLGFFADGRRRPVTAAKSLAQGDSLSSHVKIHTGGYGNAVAADQNCAFQLSQVLNRLAYPPIPHVPLFGAVATERV